MVIATGATFEAVADEAGSLVIDLKSGVKPPVAGSILLIKLVFCIVFVIDVSVGS